MSVYISYDNKNPHAISGVLADLMNTAAQNAGVNLEDTIEEHGWVEDPANNIDKAAWRLNLKISDADKTALEAHGAEVSNRPPAKYDSCPVGP